MSTFHRQLILPNHTGQLPLPEAPLRELEEYDYSGATRRGDYLVAPAYFKDAAAFVKRHHYAGGMHNGPTLCVGLWRNVEGHGTKKSGELVGVCAFATPCSENVRRSVFGPEYVDHITELHRLVLKHEIPHNAESLLIAQSLRWLNRVRRGTERPKIWAVVSFSDTTVGHSGEVYRASNAYYCGTARASKMYYDQDGRLRHPRQCGKNISEADAIARGWEVMRSGKKIRYLFTLPKGSTQRRWMAENIQLNPQFPCPKIDPSMVAIARSKA